jgi:cysteinyl-tRNA synthetase
MLPTIHLYDSFLKTQVELGEHSTANNGIIKVYSCGPTVYNYQHIGNIRAAFLPDIFARIARIAGYQVDWVLNITDVGHLVGDGDGVNISNSEDKIEKSAKSSGKTVEQIVDFYTKDYYRQAKAIGVQLPTKLMNPKATEYIPQQMILALELLRDRKAYLLEDGIYFDYEANLELTTPFDLKKEIEGSNEFTGRNLVNTTKNPADFALWKFVSQDNLQKWKFADYENVVEVFAQCDDPEIGLHGNVLNYWGTPGWHSECVAMICTILGRKLIKNRSKFTFTDYKDSTIIDVHFGGEDHIDIHHKNEILQSEALGFHLSKYWIHNKFVLVDAKKMSKSVGNVFLVVGDKESTGFESIVSRGYDPLAYRMLLLEHHYNNQLDFTWGKLEVAQTRLYNLRKEIAKIKSFAAENYILVEDLYPQNIDENDDDKINQDGVLELQSQPQIKVLLETLLDNIDTPKFLEKFTAFVLETSNEISNNQNLNKKNLQTIMFWEREFLSLGLLPTVPKTVLDIAVARFDAKIVGDYTQSDVLRQQILESGYQVDDYKWGWGIWKR